MHIQFAICSGRLDAVHKFI